jgi:hypothetical protein
MPFNTYQFQTIPNKLGSVGIAWHHQYIEYQCQYNSSIIMVLSQFSSDCFLSVWYSPDADSGNFQNTFHA